MLDMPGGTQAATRTMHNRIHAQLASTSLPQPHPTLPAATAQGTPPDVQVELRAAGLFKQQLPLKLAAQLRQAAAIWQPTRDCT